MWCGDPVGAARGGAGAAGVLLHTIGSRERESDKSRCTTAKEENTGFYEFPSDL